MEDDIRGRKVLATKPTIVMYMHQKLTRYLGWLANVTFNKDLRKNPSEKNTSSIALEFFKQVKNILNPDLWSKLNSCVTVETQRSGRAL